MALKPKTTARKLYEDYIYGTDPKAIIEIKLVRVGVLSPDIGKIVGARQVFLSSRALKHIHENRSDEHFGAILDNLHNIIIDPHTLYLDTPGKRETHIITKEIDKFGYFFCSIELVGKRTKTHFEIVTVSPCNPDKYLKGYEQMWNREDA